MVTLLFPVLTAAIESGNVRQRVNGHSRGLLHRNQPQATHTAADIGFIGSRSSEIQQNHYRRPVTSVTVYGQQQQRPQHHVVPPPPPQSLPDWTPVATQPADKSRNAADGVAVTTSGTATSDFRPDRYRPSNVAEPEAGRDRRFRNVDANAVIINDLLRGHDLNSNFDPTKIETYQPKSYENTIFPDKYPTYPPRTYVTANTVYEPRQNYNNQNPAESNLHRGYYHHQHEQHVPRVGENNKKQLAPAQNNVNTVNDPLNVYQFGQRFNFDDINSIVTRHQTNGHNTGGVDDESKNRQIFKTNTVAYYKPNFDERKNDFHHDYYGQNAAKTVLGVENNRPEIFGANLDNQHPNSSHENRHVNANDVKVGERNESFPRIYSLDNGTITQYRSQNSILNLTRNQFQTDHNIAVKKDNDGRPEANGPNTDDHYHQRFENVQNSNVDNKRYVFQKTTVNGSSSTNYSNPSISVPKSESSNVDSVNGTVHHYHGYRGYAENTENEDKPLGDGGDRRRDDDVTAATVVANNRRAPSIAANREVIERRRSTIDAAADSTANIPEFSTATAILRQRSSTASTAQPPRRRTTAANRRRPSDTAHKRTAYIGEADGSDRSGPPKNGRNRVRNVSDFSELRS